ncbi:MAG: hypothetical protein GY943_23735, partial [Chloroflexi bacterium]|nr:hypothetical protein [Chloroflexota bacterium]
GDEVDISALLETEPTAVPPTVPTNTPAPTAVPEQITPESSEAVSEVATAVPSPTPAPTNTPTPEPLPTSIILEDMGVIKQTFNNCGPANLTQVLNWYGSDITQTDVASYLKPSSEDRNVSPWQIADYVNERTSGVYRASAHSGGNLQLIKELVNAGYPVVIEKGYELPDSGWWGHYLTVFGYDDDQQILYSQDSYLGPWDGSGRIDTYEDIEFFWQQFNYTFYVVYLPQQEVEVQAILGAEMVDEFTMWRNVATLAEDETIANPDYAFAWFNLGTALTELGVLTGEAQYYQGGAQAYDKAREIGLPPRMLWYQFRPYMAYYKISRFDDVITLADATLSTQGGRNVEETFWYKGLALESTGAITDAIANYETALTVNENAYYAEWSLNALTGGN